MHLDPKHSWPPAARRRIYLMRHGDVEYFDESGRPYRPDTVPLTTRGREQARAAGIALASVPIDRAITSGLVRTNETARVVLEGRDLPMAQEPRLREIDTGRMSDWENAPPALVRQTILGALGEELTADARFLAGETFGDCLERILIAWAELLAMADWQTLLLVGHGVANRLLLSHLLGTPLSSLGRLEQDAGCINLIEVDEAGRPLVRMLNFTAYDGGKQSLVRSTFEGLYEQYLRGRSSSTQG